MTTPLELAMALGYEPEPLSWPVTSDPPIPPERFGKDHYSTLAYVEVRTVDHGGQLQHDHMRCHEGRHPLLSAAGKRSQVIGPRGGSQYPTRLKGGVEQWDHDDYDCLDDMVAAGWLTVTMPEAPEGVLVTGLIESELAAKAAWALTDLGRTVVAALRAHKADGGNFASFVPPESAA